MTRDIRRCDGVIVLAGLVVLALLTFSVSGDALSNYLSSITTLLLNLAFPCIYFSMTLMYIVVLGSAAIHSERQCLYLAFALTVLSFAMDLLYSYFWQFGVTRFFVALTLCYVFFLACFLVTRLRELND